MYTNIIVLFIVMFIFFGLGYTFGEFKGMSEGKRRQKELDELKLNKIKKIVRES